MWCLQYLARFYISSHLDCWCEHADLILHWIYFTLVLGCPNSTSCWSHCVGWNLHYWMFERWLAAHCHWCVPHMDPDVLLDDWLHIWCCYLQFGISYPTFALHTYTEPPSTSIWQITIELLAPWLLCKRRLQTLMHFGISYPALLIMVLWAMMNVQLVFGVIKLLTGWLLWHICLYFQLNAILFIGMTIAYQHCVPLPCMLHGLISCPMSTTFFARLPYVRCIINLCPSTSGGTQYCWQKVFGLCCPAISFLHLDVSFTLQLLHRTLLLLLPILLIRWTGASMTKCLNIPRPPPFFFLFFTKRHISCPAFKLGDSSLVVRHIRIVLRSAVWDKRGLCWSVILVSVVSSCTGDSDPSSLFLGSCTRPVLSLGAIGRRTDEDPLTWGRSFSSMRWIL